MILKQLTAFNRLFTMVQGADHISPAIGMVPTVSISKTGATFIASFNSTATEVGNGVYYVQLNTGDVDTVGDLAFHITAYPTADPVDFCDQVNPHIVGDLAIDSGGNIAITSNVKTNVLSNGFSFVMLNSTTGNPQPGLTVSGQRAIDGGAFASTINAPTEISGGSYTINLTSADVNGRHVMLLFTAIGANPQFLELTMQP